MTYNKFERAFKRNHDVFYDSLIDNPDESVRDIYNFIRRVININEGVVPNYNCIIFLEMIRDNYYEIAFELL